MDKFKSVFPMAQRLEKYYPAILIWLIAISVIGYSCNHNPAIWGGQEAETKQTADAFYIYDVTDTTGVVSYSTTMIPDSHTVELWSYLLPLRANKFLGYGNEPEYLGGNQYRYRIPRIEYLTDVMITAHKNNETAEITVVILRIVQPPPDRRRQD